MLFSQIGQRVIIIGLNQISLHLAHCLSANNDVVILSPKKLTGYRDDADIIMEYIDTGLPELLREYQIKGAIFIALDEKSEFNLYTGHLAAGMGARKTIAAVYNDICTELNVFAVDIIVYPYHILRERINLIMKETDLLDIKDLIPGKIEIDSIQIKTGDEICYIKLQDLDWKKTKIIAIKRNNSIFIPGGKTRLFPGDIVFTLSKKGILNDLHLLKKLKGEQRLYIYGGSELTGQLIYYWRVHFKQIVVIEPRLDRCNIMAGKYSNLLILQAKATDLQLLKEEGIDTSSTFLAVSDNDYANLLSSYGVQKLGCRDTFTLINDKTSREIAAHLNLANVLYFPAVVSENIISNLKREKIKGKYLGEGEIYADEILLKNTSPAVDHTLKELSLPRGSVIGVIRRKGEVIIPQDNSRLKAGDRVIIFFERNLANYIRDRL